jgi:RNA polymerase sigma-70 factor, ECF subfamily
MGVPEEAHLIQAARNGDDRAFERLLEPSLGLFYAGIHRILADPHDAQDALQEALLSIFGALPTFQRVSRFSTWAYRICINEALMLRRSRARIREEPLEGDGPAPGRPRTGDRPPPGRREVPQAPSAHADAEHRQMRRCIHRAMRCLPEDLRIVFALRGLEDWDTEEVARYLGITPALVRQRFHRANLKMREALGGLLQRERG